MKIRNGFVSNSSTSSFCIFGAFISSEEMRNAIEQIDAEYKFEDGGDSVYEMAEFLEEKLDLKCSVLPDTDGACFGRTAQSLKDDETGLQFKQSVQSIIQKYFPNIQCCWNEEAWYDG